LISVNLYAAGRLDWVIDQFVVPFWHAVEASGLDQYCYLWILRYSRCGEHLKLRLHGPEPLHILLQGLLNEAADAYFAGWSSLEKGPGQAAQRLKPTPPLDVEDQESNDYPDGTFLYTHYQRSPIILGAPPLMQDDHYITLFTNALSRACILVLSRFQLAKNGRMLHRKRQALLLHITAVGLSVAFPDFQELERYVIYHRDWLVRAPVLAARGRINKAEEIFDRYDAEALQLGSSYLETIRKLLEIKEESLSTQESSWQRALWALYLHLQSMRCLDPDPFVEGALYPSLFKVFHGVANQLGVTPLNEGLVWHLLLGALRGDSAREGFRLVPF
jgi:hypothetical protein